ncbi:hypothetical protein C2845_PM01G15700 [Panicum miliaceum]|uniref:Uncharacterized protein n=1 Tax=Panicum miliaceum TaxID=4540 RepID=A0A3L6TV94_PANMI|nr:hypothetical protein C2845_PM01G15700 [Panicum miliaceum]
MAATGVDQQGRGRWPAAATAGEGAVGRRGAPVRSRRGRGRGRGAVKDPVGERERWAGGRDASAGEEPPRRRILIAVKAESGKILIKRPTNGGPFHVSRISIDIVVSNLGSDARYQDASEYFLIGLHHECYECYKGIFFHAARRCRPRRSHSRRRRLRLAAPQPVPVRLPAVAEKKAAASAPPGPPVPVPPPDVKAGMVTAADAKVGNEAPQTKGKARVGSRVRKAFSSK